MNKDIASKLSEVDMVYQLLKNHGEAKGFRDLVQEVFALKDIPLDNHQLMAAIHTQMNLDNRFVFLGQGNWGLKEWSLGKVVRRNINPASLGRTVPFRRRSLTDEMEYEDTEFTETYESVTPEDDEEWEE